MLNFISQLVTRENSWCLSSAARTRKRFCQLLSVTVMCYSVSTPSRAQTVRDSAGIRIVMNTKPTWTPAQQLYLSVAPTLVIGDRGEEPYQLTRVRGAIQLSDGRIVLGEIAANELRVYDAKGIYVKTFGRKGDGPGEFRSISNVVKLAGDTIAVLHERASVSRFSSDGKYITRTADDGDVDFSKPDARSIGVLLALNGGARLAVSMPRNPFGGANGAEFDAKGFHEVLNASGGSTAKPGELPFMQAKVGKNGVEKPWLGAEEVYAGNGSQFYLGYGTQYSLTRYSVTGIPNLIIRRTWQAPQVTRGEFNVFTEEWLKRWTKSTGPKLDAERKEQLAMDYFKKLPAFSALLLDNVGRLWARVPAPIDGAVAGSLNNYSIGPSDWSVFSTAGVWLGEVIMPAQFLPTEIGTDFVLGILRDADLAPTVVRYRLGMK